MVGWNTAPTEAPTSLSAEVGAITPASARGQYVRITGEAVNVRTEPSTQSTVIVVAERGDVFGFVGRQGQWLEITMFSGDSRWGARVPGSGHHRCPSNAVKRGDTAESLRRVC